MTADAAPQRDTPQAAEMRNALAELNELRIQGSEAKEAGGEKWDAFSEAVERILARIEPLCTPAAVEDLEFVADLRPEGWGEMGGGIRTLGTWASGKIRRDLKAGRYEEARDALLAVLCAGRAYERAGAPRDLEQTVWMESLLSGPMAYMVDHAPDERFLRGYIAGLQNAERMTAPLEQFVRLERYRVAQLMEDDDFIGKLRAGFDMDEVRYDAEDGGEDLASVWFWWLKRCEGIHGLDAMYDRLAANARRPLNRPSDPQIEESENPLVQRLDRSEAWLALAGGYARRSTRVRLLMLEAAGRAFEMGNRMFTPDDPDSSHPINSEFGVDPYTGERFLRRIDGRWYSLGADDVDQGGEGSDMWGRNGDILYKNYREGRVVEYVP